MALVVDQRNFESVKVSIYRCKVDLIVLFAYKQLLKFSQGSFLDTHSKHFFNHETSFEILLDILIQCELIVLKRAHHAIYFSACGSPVFTNANLIQKVWPCLSRASK